MTLQRIEVRGVRHPIIHFRFAINQQNANIYEDEGLYMADINGVVYVLGWIDSDGTAESIADQIKTKIKAKEEP
jgi:hypothetical protein